MKARIYAEVQAGNRKQRAMRELVTGDYWCLAAIRDSPPKSRSESEEDKHPDQLNTFHSASIAVASRAAVTPGSPPTINAAALAAVGAILPDGRDAEAGGTARAAIRCRTARRSSAGPPWLWRDS
jgi:hypothetical protein